MSYVLFDLFGVIACRQSADGCARIEEAFGLAGPRFWDAYWALRLPYDRGDQAGRAYWHAVARRMSHPITDSQVAALIAADVFSWSRVDEEMVALLGSLRSRGMRLGLLSNIPEELAAYYERCQPWLGLFDALGFSCRIRAVKPEPGAYRWSAQALGAEPVEVLFVDDRAENVAAAKAVGMRGHRFTTRAALSDVLSIL